MKNQKILIGDSANPDFTFENDDFMAIEGELSVDVSGGELAIDTLAPEVHCIVKEPSILRPESWEGTEAYGVRNFNNDSESYILSDLSVRADTEVKLQSGLKVVINFQVADILGAGKQIPLFGAYSLKKKCFGAFFTNYTGAPFEEITTKQRLAFLDSDNASNHLGYNMAMYQVEEKIPGTEVTVLVDKYIYLDNKNHTLEYELLESNGKITGYHFKYDNYERTWNFTGTLNDSFEEDINLTLFSIVNKNTTNPNFGDVLAFDNFIRYYATSNRGCVNIFSCKIYKNGTLLADIIPQEEDGIGYFKNNITGSKIYGDYKDQITDPFKRKDFIPLTNIFQINSLGIKTSDGKILSGHFSEKNLRKLKNGSVVWYHVDNNPVGKFYSDTIERIARDIYRINCTSLIGLLDKQESYGGIYNGVPFKDVVDDICVSYLASPFLKLQSPDDYIAGTGQQWIDTGIYTVIAKDGNTNIIELIATIENVTDATKWLFGNDSFKIGYNSTGIVSWVNTSTMWETKSETNTYLATVSGKHSIKLQNGSIFIDNEFLGTGGASANKLLLDTDVDASASTLFIFAANDAGAGVGASSGRIWSFTMSARGKDVLKLAPYGRKTDTTGVLYDAVSGSFYESASSTKFTYIDQPDVPPENPFDISYENGVDRLSVIGWLPAASKRDNLHQLLFAYNVSMLKKPNGGILLTYASPSISRSIEANSIYAEGSVEYQKPVDNVKVTEYAFYYLSNVESESLFDNSNQGTPADYARVVFNNAPIYVPSLQTTGTLVIQQANENFAIVSGIGTLSGKPYIVSERVITKKPLKGDDILQVNEAEVSGCTLVTAQNSQKVLQRIWNYRNSTEKVKSNFVYNGEKCGEYVEMYNPFNEYIEGFIEKISLSTSSKVKADAEVVIGFEPVEGSTDYNKFVILTGSGQWQVPSGVTRIRVILIGGGTGGQAGQNGTDGNTSSYSGETPMEGGPGGYPGEPGVGGKIYIKDIEDVASYYDYACGIGGLGGTNNTGSGAEGKSGEDGTDTTFGEWSSSLGERSETGIINIFTGALYGSYGPYTSISGAPGGLRILGVGEQNVSLDGGDVSYDGSVFRGGKGKAGILSALSTSGGGAAAGANGSDGGTPAKSLEDGGPGGPGGNGANAELGPGKSTQYGQGGAGGNGGGGGGNAGEGSEEGTPGTGGYGGPGGTGADGCVLIYY